MSSSGVINHAGKSPATNKIKTTLTKNTVLTSASVPSVETVI
jgi:hypothetical protein